MGFHFHSVKTGYSFVSWIEYPLKNFGREGVNLFFTLSGFLVGGLLLKQYSEAGRIDARRFIIRRIFKIWPAYYVLILFHVFAGRHPTDTFLVQNLTHLQNYLGTSISQTWSLAVEEHFYLFLPALLLLFVRFKVGANAIIATLLGLCGIVLLARCAVVSNGDLDAAFFQTQYRIDSLLFGVIERGVWNRDATKTRPLVDAGARLYASPAEIAAGCDTVIIMLLNDAATEAVYRGPNGLLKAEFAGKLIVDMSTVRPDTMISVGTAVAQKGAAFVECPVGGSKIPAKEGKLFGLVGGEKADVARAMPVLEQLCRRIEHLGAVGSGATMKLAVSLSSTSCCAMKPSRRSLEPAPLPR